MVDLLVLTLARPALADDFRLGIGGRGAGYYGQDAPKSSDVSGTPSVGTVTRTDSNISYNVGAGFSTSRLFIETDAV